MHAPKKRDRFLKKRYDYRYDPLNRITAATGGQNSNYDVSNITYDKMGNIQSLTRNGYQDSSTFADMDILDYDYDNGNKLLKVADTGNKTKGFKDGTNTNDDFEYDINGNLKIDRNKGITSVTYNHLNLPEQVNFGSDNIKYVYDATGSKLKRTSSTGTETVYAGNHIYEGGVGNAELQFFSQPEGYVTPDGQGGYDYVYNYVDHLGSVRLSYTDADGNGSIDPANEIIEENNYYPFGLLMRSATSSISPHGNSAAKRWKFNGKEMDGTFDIDTYDFGARNYDPTIGRWMNLDPHAENYYSYSPYNYVFNSPVKFLDPDGRDGVVSGSGTEDDPYVVTANYYYYGLNKDEAKGFNASIAAYNNGGKSHKLKTKGGKVFVKFNLTATESKDAKSAEASAGADSEYDEGTGLTASWGNTVTAGDAPDKKGGDTLGNADSNHITLDRDDMAKVGQSVSKTAKGVSIHEIGHNLGGIHGDPGSLMDGVNTLTINKQIGGSTTTISNPSVSGHGLRGMIGRAVTPQGYKESNGQPASIYLTVKERQNVETDGRTGHLLIYTPKPN